MRAHIVKRPEEYCWSSYGVNAWGDTGWMQSHDEYLRLGCTLAARCYAYRALFVQKLSKENFHLIRKAAQYTLQSAIAIAKCISPDRLQLSQ